ncbi:MAG: hypothetical protein ACK5IJ_03330 [Mangrovibacterium sp.]
MKKSTKKELLFIVPNIMLSTLLMIFYCITQRTDFPFNLIPSYFFSILAAILSMYYIHPWLTRNKENNKDHENKKMLKIFSIVMLIFTVILLGSMLFVVSNSNGI